MTRCGNVRNIIGAMRSRDVYRTTQCGRRELLLICAYPHFTATDILQPKWISRFAWCMQLSYPEDLTPHVRSPSKRHELSLDDISPLEIPAAFSYSPSSNSNSKFIWATKGREGLLSWQLTYYSLTSSLHTNWIHANVCSFTERLLCKIYPAVFFWWIKLCV